MEHFDPPLPHPFMVPINTPVKREPKTNATNLFLVETFLGETFSTLSYVPLDETLFNLVADVGTQIKLACMVSEVEGNKVNFCGCWQRMPASTATMPSGV